MTNFSKVFILVENVRQQIFVRRYLYKAGLKPHAIDPEPLPGGTGGAGEQSVRKHYAAVVKKYRKRAARAKTALIVVIDADTETSGRRVRQLREALGNDAREDEESIAYFIPKRNIETWVLHLNGEQVDEETNHRSRDIDDMIPAAAAIFHEWASQPPAERLPSHSAAIQETKRLP